MLSVSCSSIAGARSKAEVCSCLVHDVGPVAEPPRECIVKLDLSHDRAKNMQFQVL